MFRAGLRRCSENPYHVHTFCAGICRSHDRSFAEIPANYRRALIAAELVFGFSSGQRGLDWSIFENRNLPDIPAVFAGLLTVIIIGPRT